MASSPIQGSCRRRRCGNGGDDDGDSFGEDRRSGGVTRARSLRGRERVEQGLVANLGKEVCRRGCVREEARGFGAVSGTQINPSSRSGVFVDQSAESVASVELTWRANEM